MIKLQDILKEVKSQFTNWTKPNVASLKKEFEIEQVKKGHEFWDDEKMFLHAAAKAKIVTISPSTDSQIQYRSHTKSFDNLLSLIKSYRSYPRYRNEDTLKALYDRFKTNKAMDMPIVIQFANGSKRIFAGNTRMDIAFQLGINPKVLLIQSKMIKLQDILKEAKSQKEIEAIAEEFITSNSYDKTHDCKQSTYEFVKWLKKTKGVESEVLLLAPPKEFKKFPGKSGDGDSHIFAIIDKIGIDFTANQFPGVTNPLKITSESNIPAEYKKIGGYYTSYPDWFPEETNGGKTFIKTTWSNLPSWMKTSGGIEDSKPI